MLQNERPYAHASHPGYAPPNMAQTDYPSHPGRGNEFTFHRHIMTDVLLDPVRKLDAIFRELINYKRDAISAANAAPKIAQSISDNKNSTTDQLKTVKYAHMLARNQAARLGLVTSTKLVRQLVVLLQSTNSPDLLNETALTLQLLAETKVGSRLLWTEFGIPILVKMLRHPSEVIFTTAMYLLNQIMWHFPDESRPEVRACSGHVGLSDLLSKGRLDDPNWIVICVDTIRMTVYRDSETKLALLPTHLHTDLVRLLRTYLNHPKVTYNVTRLIKVLGTCNENKTKLVRCEAVEALTPLLQSKNEFLVLETLWSLRNLSDHAYHLVNTETLIMRLIDLLGSTDENISICATGCLCNLTCQNVHNKSLVVENGGVTRLCQLLNLNPERQEITEPICSALRHVTHRSQHANAAIYEIRSQNTLQTIASLLLQNSEIASLPLIKAVVGLIRNIAMEDESRKEMKSLGVVRSLTHILRQTYQTANRNSLTSTEDVENLDPNMGSIEGVRLEEMIELCLVALQAMAKEPEVRDECIRTAGLLPTTVQLLYTPIQSIQRASVALLSLIASSKAGAKAIEQEGACPKLTEMIQSSNEYIAAYSAAVLHRITKDKPEEYRRRLSLELRQSLFDGGLLLDPNSMVKSNQSQLNLPVGEEATSAGRRRSTQMERNSSVNQRR
ncbi:armadillo segment polarity protein [Clonorchis sinensis]|uniref:Armadillo segment polarity protein n=1 Tax=Clonorchis sinensis TaxID=79923 RepID=H2KRE3_CLOSI|nr:armadillo segment polarity protein [Clonorchis sinensis]